ncbi:MAG: hypothetical protein JXK07_04980 [Spirochaetes bacterium]|nr:hypothetical protein [Spirochaetota bacterium]
MNRKEFLLTGCRFVAGAAFMLMGGYLLHDKIDTDNTSSGCSRSGVCRGCGAVNKCSRAEALSYKRVTGKES